LSPTIWIFERNFVFRPAFPFCTKLLVSLRKCVSHLRQTILNSTIVTVLNISLPVGFANLNGNVFVSIVRLATTTTYEDKLWDQKRVCDVFQSNSTRILFDGVPICARHRKRAFLNRFEEFFGLAVEPDSSTKSIETTWTVREGYLGTRFLVAFTHNSISWIFYQHLDLWRNVRVLIVFY